MKDYNWSEDLARLRELLDAGIPTIVNIPNRIHDGDCIFLIKKFGDRFSVNNSLTAGLRLDEVLSFKEISFIDPDPIDKTTDLDKLRQGLCMKYDELTDLLGHLAFGRKTRETRNCMDELHSIIQSIATIEGSATLKPLPPNYTTLSRYIP